MFTITIPDALEARLKVLSARYNGEQGTDLTVDEWALTVLMDMAIQEDLMKAVPDLEKERDRGFNAGLAAERVRLLDGLRAEMGTAAGRPLTGPGPGG